MFISAMNSIESLKYSHYTKIFWIEYINLNFKKMPHKKDTTIMSTYASQVTSYI